MVLRRFLIDKKDIKLTLENFSNFKITNRKITYNYFYNYREKNNKLLFFEKDILGFFLNFMYKGILGLKTGFFVQLFLNGVGFKCEKKENKLIFDLGYSHKLSYKIPEGVFFFIKRARILVFSYNKEILGLVQNEIKLLRYPDVYKGKGIIYFGQILKLKEGKKR